MFATINSRITALLLSFAFLLGSGALASQVFLKQQSDDALLVNLAGRQRMLTQKMTKESAQLLNAAHDGDANEIQAQKDQLQQTMRVFEATLFALKDGGPAPVNMEMTRVRVSPPPATPEIAKQLDAVAARWAPFKQKLEAVIHSGGTDTVSARAVAGSNLELMGQMNTAVELMQASSEQKVDMLRFVQLGALIAGIALTVLGVWMSSAKISKPLVALAKAARTMSTGDLNVEFRTDGASEVKELGASFDRMRASLIAMGNASAGGAAFDDDL